MVSVIHSPFRAETVGQRFSKKRNYSRKTCVMKTILNVQIENFIQKKFFFHIASTFGWLFGWLIIEFYLSKVEM